MLLTEMGSSGRPELAIQEQLRGTRRSARGRLSPTSCPGTEQNRCTMNFHLEERSPGWVIDAPIQIRRRVWLPATPEQVFAMLADSPGWTRWFKGMSKVRIDGPATGVGTLRTVWVGPNRVQEHFIVWEPSRQITFHIVQSSSPGLRVMVEDYLITPAGNGSTLVATVGVEAHWPLSRLPGLVRLIVGRATSGVMGITKAPFSGS